MKRKEFLQGIGLMGASTMIPIGANFAKNATKLTPPPPNTCTIIPSETAGPFPLDLTANSFYFRQDIREAKPGVQLNVKLRIIGKNNCLPMANVRVNIWHADKDGNYSGYAPIPAATHCRGYQMTDANGECEFITVFPQWYNGRVCHIHFQVFVSSVYAAVSQLTFPVAEKNAVYAANSTVYTKGADPKTPATDMVFSDGYALQVASLTPNTTTGGYDSFLEITVQGSGTTALAELEPETGGQFKLMQNFPNPYQNQTTIPFNLTNPSDVELDIWTLAGQKLTTISRPNLSAGDQKMELNFKNLGLDSTNYIYQLQVTNEHGTFRQCKMMTAF
jgi:protocatechuate 3,4-dioxygenase beta subunit